MMEHAKKWSKELRAAASDFVTNIMVDAEQSLSGSLQEIKRVQSSLNDAISKKK